MAGLSRGPIEVQSSCYSLNGGIIELQCMLQSCRRSVRRDTGRAYHRKFRQDTLLMGISVAVLSDAIQVSHLLLLSAVPAELLSKYASRSYRDRPAAVPLVHAE